MNKKLILTAALVMTVGAVAFAQGYGRMNDGYGRHNGYGRMNGGYRGGCGNNYGGHNGYGRMNGMGYDAYGYTQEDQLKIDSISQKYYSDFEKLRADMFKKSSDIRVEMNQRNPNQSKIDALIDQQSKLRADMDKLRLKVDNEIRTALGK